MGAPYDDEAGDNAGAVYIFEWNETEWVEAAKLVATDTAGEDKFGCAVSIYDDTCLIGADEKRAAYVFRRDGLNWIEEQKLVASDLEPPRAFGSAVSIDGDRALVGAYRDDDNGTFSGSAFIFKFDGASWLEETKLLPSDAVEHQWFGDDLDLTGDMAVIGATHDYGIDTQYGAAYVFAFNGSEWEE